MLGLLAAVSSSSMLNVSSVGVWGVLRESEESGNRTTVGRIVHRRSSTGAAQCHLRQCFLRFSPVLASFVIFGLRSGPMRPAVGVSAPLYGRRSQSTWGSHLCQLCTLVSFLSDGASYCGSGLGSLPPDSNQSPCRWSPLPETSSREVL